MKRMRIGTYQSELHQRQTQYFLDKVFQAYPAFKVPGAIEIIEIKPPEDKKMDDIAQELGLRDIYAREIEAALLSGDIDMAVHSVKDLPLVLNEGFELACFLPRSVPWDCLVVKSDSSIKTIQECRSIGVLSPYHADYARCRNANAVIDVLDDAVENIAIKRNEMPYDGIIMPLSDLRWLDARCNVADIFDDGDAVPVSGQGIVGVEILSDNVQAKAFLAQISCQRTEKALTCEQACLTQLAQSGHDCCAAYAFFSDNNTLHIQAAACVPDGRTMLSEDGFDAAVHGWQLGRRVGHLLAARLA